MCLYLLGCSSPNLGTCLADFYVNEIGDSLTKMCSELQSSYIFTRATEKIVVERKLRVISPKFRLPQNYVAQSLNAAKAVYYLSKNHLEE